MNPPRRLLPIGIQTLAKIRERDAYYVDKTPMALSLVQQAGYYFLSRPRRFGKSLFVDTLKEMFECNEPLFRGLYVHDKWDWQTRFPVIHISFNDGGLKSHAELQRRLGNILRVNYERLGLDNPDLPDTSDNFGELIRLAHAKFQQRVVILVDEYDKPILDNLHEREAAIAMHEREAAIAMREGLKNFYSVIKGADASIHFAFLTGVSKFSKVSLFSGLNNLRDITLLPEYSAICGYTDQDLDSVFAPELAGLDRDAIRRWYGGYNWLGDAMYNPFDLLLLFQDRKFRPYWFESGTPSFLIRMLKAREVTLSALKDLAQQEVAAASLAAFDLDYISTAALMFDAGYLTLGGERRVAERLIYKLRFPNEDVWRSLENLMPCAKQMPVVQ